MKHRSAFTLWAALMLAALLNVLKGESIVKRHLMFFTAMVCLCAAAPCARAQNGTLAAWGYNESGVVSGRPAGTFTAIPAGTWHDMAIRTDGTLVSWGDNSYGQVSNTPSGTFTAVSAGFQYSVGIRTDGTLASWGMDAFVAR